MPYIATKPGPGEAALDALVGLMTASDKLTLLNSVLALSPAINLGVTVDSTFFSIGDVDTLRDSATFPFWVCVVGGGRQDGRDTEVEKKQNAGGLWYTLWHNIYIFVHPESLPSTDAITQAAARERLRARVCDWMMYGVFNNGVNETITLGSQQFLNGTYDTLDECRVEDLTKGFILKSFGTTQFVYSAHFLHRGKIYGGF